MPSLQQGTSPQQLDQAVFAQPALLNGVQSPVLNIFPALKDWDFQGSVGPIK
jgi:hypothetical protein